MLSRTGLLFLALINLILAATFTGCGGAGLQSAGALGDNDSPIDTYTGPTYVPPAINPGTAQLNVMGLNASGQYAVASQGAQIAETSTVVVYQLSVQGGQAAGYTVSALKYGALEGTATASGSTLTFAASYPPSATGAASTPIDEIATVYALDSNSNPLGQFAIEALQTITIPTSTTTTTTSAGSCGVIIDINTLTVPDGANRMPSGTSPSSVNITVIDLSAGTLGVQPQLPVPAGVAIAVSSSSQPPVYQFTVTANANAPLYTGTNNGTTGATSAINNGMAILTVPFVITGSTTGQGCTSPPIYVWDQGARYINSLYADLSGLNPTLLAAGTEPTTYAARLGFYQQATNGTPTNTLAQVANQFMDDWRANEMVIMAKDAGVPANAVSSKAQPLPTVATWDAFLANKQNGFYETWAAFWASFQAFNSINSSTPWHQFIVNLYEDPTILNRAPTANDNVAGQLDNLQTIINNKGAIAARDYEADKIFYSKEMTAKFFPPFINNFCVAMLKRDCSTTEIATIQSDADNLQDNIAVGFGSDPEYYNLRLTMPGLVP